jgi:hypothetical protein
VAIGASPRACPHIRTFTRAVRWLLFGNAQESCVCVCVCVCVVGRGGCVCLCVEAVLWPNGLQLNVAVYKPHVSQPDPVSKCRAPCLHTRTHEVVTKCRCGKGGWLVGCGTVWG